MKDKQLVPKQMNLPFKVVKQAEIEGIPMGVLENGTPYLTMRGLARLCGVNHQLLLRMASDWSVEKIKPRGKRISELLQIQGFTGNKLYIEVTDGKKKIHAYPDDVCMAILEYYAFDSAQGSNEIAITNYRLLARQTLRTFIYTKVGYDPENLIPEIWRQYHDRVTLTDMPKGYFCVFREIADIIVFSIQGGVPVGPSIVPDISVGISWASHWKKIKGDSEYGERTKWEHNYPDYFPQAKSNPQDINIYPLAALGEFRIWVQNEYLPQKFPNYLKTKVKKGALPASDAELLLEAIEQNQTQIQSNN